MAARADDDTDDGLRRIAAGLLLSLVAHLLLLLALLIPHPPPPVIETPGIAVEILPAEPAAPETTPLPVTEPPVAVPPAAAPPAAGPPLAAPADVAAPPAAADAPPPGWVGAGRMISAGRLAEPRNRAVARHLAAMPADLRDEQLCDFEAVEQLSRPGRAADQVVAYALGDPRDEAGVLVAEGAAVRIAGKWYRLAFRCRVAGRPAAVVAFAHKLGAAIPRRDWADLGLAAAGDD
jgi:hypothetical protein